MIVDPVDQHMSHITGSPPEDHLPPRVPVSQTVPDSVIVSNKQLTLIESWIVSRIEYNKVAVSNSGFEDLRWFEGKYHKSNFERQIMENSDEEFIIEDYEVFRVVRCCE
ncbi:7671_t:CDS:2 [Rhizophagus irregularis]|nr:7671_t:CDS:2 [Rhizophagus irregularis]